VALHQNLEGERRAQEVVVIILSKRHLVPLPVSSMNAKKICTGVDLERVTRKNGLGNHIFPNETPQSNTNGRRTRLMTSLKLGEGQSWMLLVNVLKTWNSSSPNRHQEE
jgi:hypothetical protein